MGVTIYNEVSLEKLGDFKQKIIDNEGNLPKEDVESLKRELKKTQMLCKGLGSQLAKTKVEVIKKDDVIAGLGKQQANTKLELIKLKKSLQK